MYIIRRRGTAQGGADNGVPMGMTREARLPVKCQGAWVRVWGCREIDEKEEERKEKKNRLGKGKGKARYGRRRRRWLLSLLRPRVAAIMRRLLGLED